MFIDKLKLKEQIRIGKVDIKLLQTCQLFDHFRDSEALKLIAIKLFNKTLNLGDVLFDQEYEQRQIYIILFGQVGDFKTGDCFDYHHFKDKVTVYHQTDLIYMNKSMYDFLLEENHQKGVRQISSFIAGHKMFKNLTTGQLIQFCQSLRIKVVNDNWPIVNIQELPKYGYIVVKGVLKGIKNKFPICEFKKGDAVCVYDCLFNQEMQFTIVPHQQTTLIEMDKRLLMDWVEHLVVDRQIITINEDSIRKAKEWEKFKKKTLKQIYK